MDVQSNVIPVAFVLLFGCSAVIHEDFGHMSDQKKIDVKYFVMTEADNKIYFSSIHVGLFIWFARWCMMHAALPQPKNTTKILEKTNRFCCCHCSLTNFCDVLCQYMYNLYENTKQKRERYAKYYKMRWSESRTHTHTPLYIPIYRPFKIGIFIASKIEWNKRLSLSDFYSAHIEWNSFVSKRSSISWKRSVFNIQ